MWAPEPHALAAMCRERCEDDAGASCGKLQRVISHVYVYMLAFACACGDDGDDVVKVNIMVLG